MSQALSAGSRAGDSWLFPATYPRVLSPHFVSDSVACHKLSLADEPVGTGISGLLGFG